MVRHSRIEQSGGLFKVPNAQFARIGPGIQSVRLIGTPAPEPRGGEQAKRPPRGGGSGAAKSKIWHLRIRLGLLNLPNGFLIRWCNQHFGVRDLEKKYQIFVSSTFVDLKEERQAISRAVLNLDHIPAGMELFPAFDSDQFSYIRKVVDDCDYYILVIGGRYGSIGPEGLSYTEMEYDYATETKKPTLVFIHRDIGELPSKFVDASEEQNEKLNAFKEKVSRNRLVSFWSDVRELESQVITALAKSFSDHPQTGWRRDSNELSKEALKQINDLSKNVEYWRGNWSGLHAKVTDFESLKTAQIQLRFELNDEKNTATFSCATLIREFAYGLRAGLVSDEIELGIHSILTNANYGNISKIDERTIQDVIMFFEVFEIGVFLNGVLKISDEKVYLLKAAFQPIEKVVDSEIPF